MQRLRVFLVSVVSFLAKNLTAILIVVIFIEGYIRIESTDAIVTLYLFISNSSSLSSKSNYWTMDTHE